MRRKARRYQYGAYAKRTGTRCKGLTSVAEVPFLGVRRDNGEQVSCVVIRLADVPSIQLRFPLKASEGAEKSCYTKRRKRGLRKGKRRSRVCQTRRTASRPATSSKSPSARKVNHVGRKFVWAAQARSNLAKDCEKLNKFPRGHLHSDHRAYAPRVRMKQYCLVKWTRLHKQATAIGLPPVVAFHSDFFEFLLKETSRGRKAALSALDELVFGLAPVDHTTHADENTIVSISPRNRPRRGRKQLPPVRICRMCGYGGRDDHPWNSCKTISKTEKSKKSGRPLRRR